MGTFILIRLQHIKALSKNATRLSRIATEGPLSRKTVFFRTTETSSKTAWCTINRSEKDAHVGVLSKVAEDHLILINHAQLLYIPTSCISTIHSEIPKHQILLANQQPAPTIQETQVTPVETVEMEIQLPFIQEVHRELELVPQLVEFLIARGTAVNKDNSELQILKMKTNR